MQTTHVLTGVDQYHLANTKDLDPLMERIGDARIVMLGEASHGTHEYYAWRMAISKRLIEEKGFDFIAVEGDWPDSYKVNRYVKGYDYQDKSPAQVLRTYNRWPTWMWANWEIVSLITWLKDFNAHKQSSQRVGFYGLDVYSLWESLEALVEYLKRTDTFAAKLAQRVLNCFSGYGKNEELYAIGSLSSSCKEEAIRLLTEIRLSAAHYNGDPEASLNTTQNAFITVEAEKYYRNMVSFDDKTWNIRDKHMTDTLDRLLEFHGIGSKAIVWEHNTHIGDASYTDMKKAGMYNLGQLARERYTENEVVLVGFGSYEGTVMAGQAWGSAMQEMELPEAASGSIEELLHNESDEDRLLIFDRTKDKLVPDETILHRAVGVVYDPASEECNYVPSVMRRRYDAFIYIDQTKALHPLYVRPDLSQVPEEYPFDV